jgi:hypothetical protein
MIVDSGNSVSETNENNNANQGINLDWNSVSVTISDWFDQNLRNATLRTDARSRFADGRLDRNDMIALFRDTETDGVIDSTELTDLRTLIGNTAYIVMPAEVRALSNKIANGTIANQYYQGSILGNLAAGSTASQLEKLIGKWFLGLDRPTAPSGYNFTYQPVLGSLFGTDGSFNYQDIQQGYLGDCYFLASLGATAFQNPSAIQNMFINNGDGTYTVRLFGESNGIANSTPDYVTVDSYLPTNVADNIYSGQHFAYYDSQTTGLWVALAEKAYAQFAEAGVSDRPSTLNSYGTIISGNSMEAMPAISGKNASCYADANYLGKVGNFSTLTVADIANQLAAGKALTAATISNPGLGIVGWHEYIITRADTINQQITLYNPWGTTQTGEINGTRVLSLADFKANFNIVYSA